MSVIPILEGLVTTTNADGVPHLAPMGPRVHPDGRTLLLRPFASSQTFQNLKRHSEGVLHVTDDVLLLARAALGRAALPANRAADKIRGHVLLDCCRYLEFRVQSIDESDERVQVHAEVVHFRSVRDFWGFNRGKHAVIEAAILMTRLHLLPVTEVAAAFERFRVIVEKTGGPAEFEAFAFLEGQLELARRTIS